jgi:hypothetical protein
MYTQVRVLFDHRMGHSLVLSEQASETVEMDAVLFRLPVGLFIMYNTAVSTVKIVSCL